MDTTGAGDGFIGSFLNQLAYEGRTLDDMKKMTDKEWESYLIFQIVTAEKAFRKKERYLLTLPDRKWKCFWLRIGHC